MILKGKTNIGEISVNDLLNEHKQSIGISEKLSPDFDWNVEIHLCRDRRSGPKLLHAALFISRQAPKGNFTLFTETSNNHFEFDRCIIDKTYSVAVENGSFTINDVEIFNTDYFDHEGIHIFGLGREDKEDLCGPCGILGFQCNVIFSEESSCEQGWDLLNSNDVKEMFEHVFKTKFDITELEDRTCDKGYVVCPYTVYSEGGKRNCYNNCGEGSIHYELDNAISNQLEALKKEVTKVIINMEGGIVQSVLTDSNEFVNVIVMDQDNQSEPYEDSVEVMKTFIGESKFRIADHDSTLVPDDYEVSVVEND